MSEDAAPLEVEPAPVECVEAEISAESESEPSISSTMDEMPTEESAAVTNSVSVPSPLIDAKEEEPRPSTSPSDKENKMALNNDADKAESESEDESTVTGTYIVEKILDKRFDTADSEWKYFIKWLGWPSYTNTWEPERNLFGCNEKLAEFEQIWEEKARRKRERALMQEMENEAKKANQPEPEPKVAKVETTAAEVAEPKKKARKRRRRY